MRVFYIVLANLALPFVLFYLRNILYKMYYVYVKKDYKKKPPSLDWPLAVRLLFAGVLLLSIVLFYNRIQIQPEQRLHINQVKEQDFR